LARYRELLREDVELFTYIQFLFFRQWTALKSYINSLGIGIIGDLPIYVAMDSADVWAERSMFRLDSRGVPTEVAGVPPDYFSKDGQLWGNPLYDYDAMKRDGFGWWIRRVDGAARLYDVIRIDHFRGFASYWAVPYGSPTAKTGRWVKGPGLDLLNVLTGWFHGIRFIAEDLGEDVQQIQPRPLDPAAGFGGRRTVGHRPIAGEAPEMVNADHVIQSGGAVHPANPPAEAVPLHGVIIVERIAPKLAVLGEVVRRNTGHLCGNAPAVQTEHGSFRPDVSGVHSHIDRQVTDNAHAKAVDVGL
jgi:hypothetical protein